MRGSEPAAVVFITRHPAAHLAAEQPAAASILLSFCGE
jgi:hypothetical protein